MTSLTSLASPASLSPPRALAATAAIVAIAAPLAGLAAALISPADAVTAPARAAEEVRVSPTAFDRGEDTDVPALLDGDVVVGGTVIPVPGTASNLLGASGDGYLVATTVDDRGRIVRVAEGAAPVTVVTPARAADPRLTSDGSTLLLSRYRTGREASQITAIDAATGERIARREFPRYVYALDGTATLAVVSSSAGSRTLAWTFGDGVRAISDQAAYFADLTTNTLALFTADPYQDGCTRVAPLDRPGQTVWRDCQAAVVDVAPDGRLATIYILSDGLGPGAMTVRTATGRPLTTYESGRGVVWPAGWESDGSVVLEVNGRTKAALLSCDGSDCERTSDYFGTGIG